MGLPDGTGQLELLYICNKNRTFAALLRKFSLIVGRKVNKEQQIMPVFRNR
jgi:hypothetical protein